MEELEGREDFSSPLCTFVDLDGTRGRGRGRLRDGPEAFEAASESESGCRGFESELEAETEAESESWAEEVAMTLSPSSSSSSSPVPSPSSPPRLVSVYNTTYISSGVLWPQLLICHTRLGFSFCQYTLLFLILVLALAFSIAWSWLDYLLHTGTSRTKFKPRRRRR